MAENTEYPQVRVGAIGGSVRQRTYELDDIARALHRVGMTAIAREVQEQSDQMLKLADELEQLSDQLVTDAVQGACQATDNMFLGALAVVTKLENTRSRREA